MTAIKTPVIPPELVIKIKEAIKKGRRSRKSIAFYADCSLSILDLAIKGTPSLTNLLWTKKFEKKYLKRLKRAMSIADEPRFPSCFKGLK